MQIRVNVNYFYALWTQKDICLKFFKRCIFSFQIYADFMWCSYLYTWLYKRISIWPLLTNIFLYASKFLRGSPWLCCFKNYLLRTCSLFFKFINIGLAEKLISLNKLITTRYIAKPSHCEFYLVWQYLPVCLTYGVEAQQD